MRKAEKWICIAIGAFLGTAIVTVFTGEWSCFWASWIISIIPTGILRHLIFERREPRRKQKSEPPKAEPFNVTEYSRRREKYLLSLEEERRVEYTIVLWLGYDGLRLNKDGSREWISRKPPEPISQGVFYQPMQSMAQVSYPIDYSMCQNAQATREQIYGLRMQLEMQNFNAAMQNQTQGFNSALQSFVIQTPMYPSYIYAGSMQSPLTGCCCNQTILR